MFDNVGTSPSCAARAFNVSRLIRELDLVTDNYYTRHLAGANAYSVPLGGLTSQHKRVALQSLRAIDWVLPLGSLHTELILTSGLGWRPGTMAHPALEGRLSASRIFSEFCDFTRADRNILEQLNAPDVRLFEEAKRLHALDVDRKSVV